MMTIVITVIIQEQSCSTLQVDLKSQITIRLKEQYEQNKGNTDGLIAE